MFINSQLMGMSFGFPDVCETPSPVGTLPIPYPNISLTPMAVPAVYNVLIGLGPAHNMLTMVPMTQGDDAGVALGVVSGMVMGPCRHLLGAFTVLVGGMPATRLLDMTGHNGLAPNTLGATVVPSQVTVLCLAP